jgi:hypothetical protein
MNESNQTELTTMHDDEPPAYNVTDIHNLSPAISLTSILQDGSIPEERDDDSDSLPDYTPANLPIYSNAVTSSMIPLASFAMHQTNRSLRTVVPIPSMSGMLPTYTLTARTGPKLFTCKPDIKLSRLISPRIASSSSSELASPRKPSQMSTEVAHLGFPTDTTFPWHPRARITLLRNPLCAPRRIDLSAPNFRDFHVSIAGSTARTYTWTLTDAPSTGLALVERSEGRVVARFEYSCVGTDASKGEQVGRLDIFEMIDDEDGDGAMGQGGLDELDWIEVVLGGMELVKTHWQNMGKHFKKNVRLARCAGLFGIESAGPMSTGRMVSAVTVSGS